MLVIFRLLDEMGHDMTLQMVYVYQGNTQGAGETLGETDTYQKGTHQTGSTGKGYGRQLLLCDTGFLNCLIHNRYHILLMGTGSQFRHNATISLMHRLRSSNI